MKTLLQITACLLMLAPATYYSQLNSGTMAPDFTATDLDGNTWTLSELNASGKEVILMFTASWSIADWNYLETNALQDYYTNFGPQGTNEVVVLLIEASDQTTLDDIYGLTEQSTGDVTSIVNFPIIHDDPLNLFYSYNLLYYPTIYRVCQNGILSELFQEDYATLINGNYDFCSIFGGDVNPHLDGLSLELDCQNVNATIVLKNYGALTLTSCSIHVTTETGYDQTIEWTGNLAPMQNELIQLGNFDATEPSIITVEISSTDEVLNEAATAQLNVSEAATSHLRLEIFTDNYPEEIEWDIINYNYENVVSSELYTIAQNLYIHDIYLNSEECYIFYLMDTFGDGLMIGNGNEHIYLHSVEEDGDLNPIFIYNGDYEYIDHMQGFEVVEIVPMSIAGQVYLDINENAYHESTEPGIGGIEVHLDELSTFTDENGNYIFNDVEAISGDLSIVYDETLYPTATTPTNVSLVGATNSTFNFGLSTNDPNYNLNFTYTEPWFFCGFDGYVWFTVSNNGNQIADGTISITLDPLLTYQNANIQPTSINGNVYIWDIEDLGLGENIYFCLYIMNPGFEFMGQNIVNSITLTTFDNEGNSMGIDEGTYPTTLLCSYDPNDKAGEPAGETEAHYIPIGTPIEYRIRFQNTGNYQAFNIHVLDQIDADLDLSTLQILGTSHYCQPTINTETREVDFFFPDIMLPDSTSNEQESHGFIRYTISQMPDLPEMTTIENTGYIYFDFNPAVITNTTLHTVSDLYFGIQEQQQSPIAVYPNPASDNVMINLPTSVANFEINVFDLQGRMVMQNSNNFGQRVNLSCETLAAGTYQVEIMVDGHRLFSPAKLIITE
jgi:uncharacterized repeat protein (TIGR01451 family)